MKDLARETQYLSFKQKTAVAHPIIGTSLGYITGNMLNNAVKNHNQEVNELEQSVQNIVADYRVQEQKIEQIADSLPGLNLWMKGYEKIFGEAQQTIGITETKFTKINPEDINLHVLEAPQISYPLLGATIGLAIGLYKASNKISQYSKEKKILRWMNANR